MMPGPRGCSDPTTLQQPLFADQHGDDLSPSSFPPLTNGMLEELPAELLDLCWQHCNFADLRALRLTNRSISPTASSHLFRQVVLLPTKQSAQRCLQLMEHDTLRLSVASITFIHDIEGEDRDDGSDEDGSVEEEDGDGDGEESVDEEYIEFPRQYRHCCRNMMTRFTNLQSVDISFSDNVAAPEKEGVYGWGKEVPEFESLQYRDIAIRSVFNGLHHSPVTLKRLTVRNLQNLMVPDTVSSDSFKTALSGLTSLALQIATERDDACPENDLNKSELHAFFNQDLPRVWLQPLQTNLTSLTLYADNYWGYFPSCPLAELHFPRLVHLALGNHSFSHDAQLVWILTHGSTLESLSLDDCPILHHCTMHCGFLDERRPRNVKDFEVIFDNEETWTYDARWYNYFLRIQTGLPQLQDFRFGHGDWDASGGPMINKHRLEQKLVAGRYVAFHGGTGPSQWIEPREGAVLQKDGSWLSGYAYDGCWDDEAQPNFPGCDEEDAKALSDLLEAIRSR